MHGHLPIASGRLCAHPGAQIHLDPKAVAAAMQLRKAGNIDGAVQSLRGLQTSAPDDPAVLGELGYALIDDNQPEEAVSVFDHMTAVDPANVRAYNGKGMAFDRAGNVTWRRRTSISRRLRSRPNRCR